MLRRCIKNVALATIWNPNVIHTFFSAGEGTTFWLRFGAKLSEFAGEPLNADVVVRRTQRDTAQSFGQSVVPLGDAVWIDVGGIDVILNSVRSLVYNPDVFSNSSIDLRRKNSSSQTHKSLPRCILADIRRCPLCRS